MSVPIGSPSYEPRGAKSESHPSIERSPLPCRPNSIARDLVTARPEQHDPFSLDGTCLLRCRRYALTVHCLRQPANIRL